MAGVRKIEARFLLRAGNAGILSLPAKNGFPAQLLEALYAAGEGDAHN
jgi:hypothetical protein